MKILLADDEEDLRKVLSRALARRCGVEVLEASSGNAGIELLKSNPDVDLIISDYHMDNGSGGDFFKYLVSVASKIPFVLHSSAPIEDLPEFKGHAIAGSAQKPEGMDALVAVIEKFKNTAEVDAQAEDLFLPVELEILERAGTAPCPYYVQLSDSKYVKVVNGSDVFGRADLERFKGKGLGSLHIRTADCALLVAAIARSTLKAARAVVDLSTPESIRQLAEHVPEDGIRKDLLAVASMLKLSKDGSLKPEDSLDPLVKLHENLRQQIKELGFSESVQIHAKVCAQFAMEAVGSVRALKPVLDRIRMEPTSYLSGHAVYLAHLATAICMQMPWESEASRQKLALAAFLHDMSLEDERLARVKALPEGDTSFTEGELEQIRNHPVKSAELLKSADPMIYRSIESLVLHHHERSDGRGFPGRVPPMQIPPLSAVFIVAHDLVDYLMTVGANAKMLDFLLIHEEEYQVGQFKKVAAALNELCKK